jgi:large exoprotein involved in heme utilization and adhesion
VDIQAVNLKLINGAAITAESSSDAADAGGSGAILVEATKSIQLIGGKVLATVANGSQPGGDISLSAGQDISLTKSQISVKSEGLGNAGDIQLTAMDTILLDEATVTTEATQASGGNIKLTSEELISLNDSIIESSVQGDETTESGDINLDPDFIILQNSQILAQAVEGRGGNITLIANDAVLVDSFSRLDASSALGISGTVNIQAPTKFLSGAIVPLESQPVEVATLYGARCVAGAGGHFSTFVDYKTDGLSPTPGTFLASPLLLPSDQGVADSSARPENPVILTASIAPLVLGQSSEPTTACP